MQQDTAYGEDAISIKEDVVYGRKFGLALTFDILQPQQQNGAAVLFFNSGGFYSPIFVREDAGTAGSRWMLFQATQGDKIVDLGLQFSFAPLLARGFTVFDIRHGSSPKFMLDEITVDCRLAVQFIGENAQKFGIDPRQIGAWGMSAGGYLAALVGASQREGRKDKEALEQTSGCVNAVVAYFPSGYDWTAMGTLPETIPALKIDPIVLDSLSLKHYISGDTSPALIIYGDEDASFITEESDAFFAGLKEKGVESKLIVIPQTGHLFIGEDDQFNVQAGELAMSELLFWFEKHLTAN